MKILAIILTAVLSRLALYQMAASALNSDGAVYPLTSDWMRQGHWASFQVNYPYGGNTLTWLRMLWVSVGDQRFWLGAMEGGTYWGSLFSHAGFSHFVMPSILSLSFYFLIKKCVSDRASFFTALVVAVGFQSWDRFLHIEFYAAYLIFGALLLGASLRGWMTRYPFWMGIVSGLAFYTCRATLVYIVAAWFSFPWIKEQALIALRRPSSTLEKILWGFSISMLALYFYLEAFGANLGTLFGRPLRIHAGPNLHLAVLGMGLLWLQRGGLKWVLDKRVAFAGIGFVMGFLPEILPSLLSGRMPPATGGRNYSWEDTFTALGRIPSSLREIWSPLSVEYQGDMRFWMNASMVLLVWAIYVGWKRMGGLKSVALFSGFLAAFAYTRVLTYDLAPPRYLLPIFPALIVLLAAWVEWMLQLKAERLFRPVVALGALLMALHLGGQWWGRLVWAHHQVEKSRIECPQALGIPFLERGIKYVLTDDHWCGNQLSVFYKWDPFVFHHPSPWALPVAPFLAAEQSSIGLLRSKNETIANPFEILGKSYRVEKLTEIGNKALYQLTIGK